VIFDGINSSSILHSVADKGVPCVIYSHTAAQNTSLAAKCKNAGAQVLDTSAELRRALALASHWPSREHTIGQALPGTGRRGSDVDEDRDFLEKVMSVEESLKTPLHTPERPGDEEGGWPHSSNWEEYGPIQRWLQYVEGGAVAKLETAEPRGVLLGSEAWSRCMIPMMSSLTLPVTLPGRKKVRFVVLSDTHTHHRLVAIPPGDVLLHCGDLVSNYGKGDSGGLSYPECLISHLKDSLAWLAEQANRFQLVIFIGGNHDTILDHECYPAYNEEVTRLLGALPPNCVYLKESGIHFRGIPIYGYPYCPSRLETLGQRFYSDGFERNNKFRLKVWGTIPEGLGVLMTHVPPYGQRSSPKVSDKLLSHRLSQMSSPPQFHVFGHDHDFPGFSEQDRTVYINASQQGLVNMDPEAKGCAWIFDCPTPEIDF